MLGRVNGAEERSEKERGFASSEEKCVVWPSPNLGQESSSLLGVSIRSIRTAAFDFFARSVGRAKECADVVPGVNEENEEDVTKPSARRGDCDVTRVERRTLRLPLRFFFFLRCASFGGLLVDSCRATGEKSEEDEEEDDLVDAALWMLSSSLKYECDCLPRDFVLFLSLAPFFFSLSLFSVWPASFTSARNFSSSSSARNSSLLLPSSSS